MPLSPLVHLGVATPWSFARGASPVAALACRAAVSRHPLDRYAAEIAGSGASPTSELCRHVGRRVRLAGCPVGQKPVRGRDGRVMTFVTFEDATALSEAVLFADADRRTARRLLQAGFFLVEGIVPEEQGAVSVEGR